MGLISESNPRLCGILIVCCKMIILSVSFVSLLEI